MPAVLWEADLTDQGDVIFADGAQVITGLDGTPLTFTIANTDRAASGAVADWGFEQGVGLNFLAAAVTGTWTAATQTAARLTIPHATLMSTFGFDMRAKVLFEVYAPVITFTTQTPDFGIGWQGTVGTPANSGNRMWATKRAYRGGTDVSLGTGLTGDSVNYTSAPGPTANVLAIANQGGNTAWLMISTWTGDWPALDTIIGNMAGAGGTLPSINSLVGTVMGMAFASNGIAGTMRVRAARMRLSVIV